MIILYSHWEPEPFFPLAPERRSVREGCRWGGGGVESQGVETEPSLPHKQGLTKPFPCFVVLLGALFTAAYQEKRCPDLHPPSLAGKQRTPDGRYKLINILKRTNITCKTCVAVSRFASTLLLRLWEELLSGFSCHYKF